MKICINRTPIDGPWGGGNMLVSAFWRLAKEAGHEVVGHLAKDLDAILVIDPRYESTCPSIKEIAQYKAKYPKTRLVQRINECDARKGTTDMDPILLACSEVLDKTIFVSDWIKEYHTAKGWKCRNSTVIYNGVDHQAFKPRARTWDKHRIVTHHWSNNTLKGFDVYNWLDGFVKKHPEYQFTYIGRDQKSFKNALVIPPLHGAALGHALAEHDIYISGSRFDPGPNHVLESLACGLPTYVHTQGGGAVEFAGKDHAFGPPNELYDILLKRNWIKNAYAPTTWEECIKRYLQELAC